MKTRITLIVMLLLTVALFWHGIGCKKNPVAPPDPRHLTWTVDTLRYPDSFQTLMYGIWGSSPNDVYAVGHTNVVRGNMYHYNGKSWQDVLLASGWGGNIRGSFSLSGVYGFSPGDVWVVGRLSKTNPNPPPNSIFSSLVIHFDGRQWQEVVLPVKQGELLRVWGGAPDDVWFGGRQGALYHYDGASVTLGSLPFPFKTGRFDQHHVQRIAGAADGKTYLLVSGWADFGSRKSIFYERRNNGWVMIDSTFYSESLNLWVSPSGNVYSTTVRDGSDEVFLREGRSWVQHSASSQMGIRSIHGTADSNIWAVGSTWGGGRALHYNGSDWYRLPELELPDCSLIRVYVFEHEVFILGDLWNSGFSIVVHGK